MQRSCPVRSFTEWDRLEEVIVGVIDGAVYPTWQPSMQATMPEASWDRFRTCGGRPLPKAEVGAARRELDHLARVLEAEGIVVTRPDIIDHGRCFSSPDWSSHGGLYAAMPRDLLLVVGDCIIEAPLSWRCRHYEVNAFRTLLKAYFRRGGRWLAAPRPELVDELYIDDDAAAAHGGWCVTEFEPVFDAADFVRFGRDILVQKSHVTNEFGIAWLQSALGDEYRVRTIDVNDPHAMHIDATLLPLAPGKLLVNPERYVHDPVLFRGWDVLEAPPSVLPADWPMYFCSTWVNMNVLSLDERRVVVEQQEEPLIRALTDWGFECIRVPFRHVNSFGGAFHCVTLDVRRDGPLASYLG